MQNQVGEPTATLSTDLLILPSNRCSKSAAAIKTYANAMKELASSTELLVVYKEKDATLYDKGMQHLSETVYMFGHKHLRFQSGQRLHYQLTTLSSDVLIQVDHFDYGKADREDRQRGVVTKAEKIAVLGERALLPQEADLAPEAKVFLFHNEKHPKFWEEFFFSYSIRTAVVASASAAIIQAAVKRGVTLLALVRNEAHMVVCERTTQDFIFHESENNPDSPFYLARADLITKLGLEPDAVEVDSDETGEPPAKKPRVRKGAAGKGAAVKKEEVEEEEEEAGQEDEDDEEEEEEEEEDEQEEQDDEARLGNN